MIIFTYILLMMASQTYSDVFDRKNVMRQEILSLSATQKFSSGCKSDLLEMWKYSGVSVFFWPWRILDASSKLPSGVESMSDDTGQFDECIEAGYGEISGKYCLGNLQIVIPLSRTLSTLEKKHRLRMSARELTQQNNNVTLSTMWAGCLPSSCNAADFEKFYNSIITKTVPGISVTFNDTLCSTKNDEASLTFGAIFTIAFFAMVLLIMVSQTCYDMYCQHYNREAKQILTAFSVYTNSAKLFKMAKNSNQLECLNGLKFFSMLWVIVGHTYSFFISNPIYSHETIVKWADSLHSMLIINGILSVDTFFLVGGVLVAYVYLQAMEKKTKFNLFMFYFHRYIRLTPALAALILVTSTIYPYFGSGPNWSLVRVQQEYCTDYWWATLLYIGNYFAVGHMCIPHGWYLYVDMQLYLISPIILYALRKYHKLTILGLLATVLGICCMNFLYTWYEHYPALLSNIYVDNVDYMKSFYIKTHTRAGSWLCGIVIGYFVFQLKQNKLRIKLHWVLIITIWVACFALTLTCIFIGHESLRTAEYNKLGNSLHIGFMRLIWSIANGWIIIACVSGYGGPVNWALSLPVYQVFNRFAYSIYLIHYMLIACRVASIRAPVFFSDIWMGYFFWGNLWFTCIISYFWVLAFESPVIILEKILLAPLMKSK